MNDLLEPRAYCFQARWYVLVKEYSEIGALGLRLTCVDPAADVPVTATTSKDVITAPADPAVQGGMQTQRRKSDA